MSIGQQGRPKPPRSLEHRRKLGLANMGRTHTIEARAKMSISRTGKKLTAEHKASIALGRTGKRHSMETLLKMSTAQKLRYNKTKESTNGNGPQAGT